MSTMDYVNYWQLQETQQAGKNQESLTDLQGRAESIEKRTGASPDSWYEFKRANPVQKQTSVVGAVVGVLLGTLFGAGIASFFAPLAGGIAVIAVGSVIGAALGGLVGYNYDSPNSQRERQIKAYENYLDAVETTVSMSRAPQVQQEPNIAYRSDHAERVTGRQNAPQFHQLG